jgi:hypothetical protein
MKLFKLILNCKPMVFLKNILSKQWENYSNFFVMHSFLFTIILKKLNIDENLFSDIVVYSGAEHTLYHYSLGVLATSLVTLFSLINVLGYFISIYLIHKYDIKNKYPKYSKLISYFENSSLVFVIFEVLLCLICLTSIVVFSFLIFNQI